MPYYIITANEARYDNIKFKKKLTHIVNQLNKEHIVEKAEIKKIGSKISGAIIRYYHKEYLDG